VRAQPIDDAAWRLRKAKSLIKLLALTPKHRIHREQVMEVLWPELERDGAANNLHKVLHIARHTIEPGGTHSRPVDDFADEARGGERGGGTHARPVGGFADEARGGESGGGRAGFTYLLLQGDFVVLTAPHGLITDVEAFEAAATVAQLAADPALYQRALRLYTGDLLPEDPYEDWVAGRREALKALWCTLSLELADLWERQGAIAAATAVVRQVAAGDPAHEAAQFCLMRLLARSGQRHLALRQYEQLREALHAELDVEPSPHIKALYQQLRSGVTAPPAPAVPAAPMMRAANPAPPGPLVGRGREMTYLRERLSALGAGHGGLVLIRGATGVGKSHLLAEATEQAAGQGMLVLRGTASRHPPRRACVSIIEALEEFMRGDAPTDVVALWDDLAVHLDERAPSGIPETPPHGVAPYLPAGSRWPMFAALSVVFKRLTARGPVVLALDDLDMADACCWQVVRHLARKARTMPVLVLGTCRLDTTTSVEPLAGLTDGLVQEGVLQWLDLRDLGLPETEQVVTRLLGAPVDAAVLQAVDALARGNVFYIQEAVHALRGRGQIYVADGRWRVHEHTSAVWGRDFLRHRRR
jgi:DNA-binding SARP family transcriptional activator